MKLDHPTRARSISRSMLTGLGLVWFASACGGSTQDDSAPLEDLSQSLRSGPGQSRWGRSPARGSRAHGPRGHRQGSHHGGGSHGGPPGGGMPVPLPQPCGPFDPDNVFQTLNADLARLDADDQPFARYLSLVNRAHVLGCGAALDGERAALSKLVNSLSINASVQAPVPIDVDLTLYRIDLRDYDWDRPIRVEGIQFADAWEAVIATSPYALPYIGDDADDTTDDTGTSVPVLFGSAFVAAAARDPLYYALLGIPSDADDFLRDDLGIDVARARADGETVRAGFVARGQGGNAEFLAERFDLEVRAGVAWQISKFSNDLGDLFDDPLGNATGEREIVFSLPNGLQGHILADGSGEVISTSNVLIDGSEEGARAHIATSLLRSRANGVELDDEVRGFVLANPGNFSAAERAAILEAYPADAQLQELLADDREGFFARALELIGLDIDTTPEPISASFAAFNADVDLATAAGDLLLTPEDLSQNLDLLDPVFSVLEGGGRLDRDDFTTLYGNALCIFSVVLENQPDVVVCDALAAAALP